MTNSISVENLRGVETQAALNFLAELVDCALDEASQEKCKRLEPLFEEISTRQLENEQLCYLHYYWSNFWGNLYQLSISNEDSSWEWNQSELQKQIFYLRSALINPAFDGLPSIVKCSIWTNLANAFDTIGRFIDARAYYTAALAVEPHFWMALGNRGRAAMHYGSALYDNGHFGVAALFARNDLLSAIFEIENYPHYGDTSLVSFFAESCAAISGHFDIDAIEREYQADGYSLGKSKSEVNYRKWALENQLFLNPLNDFETKTIAAQDILTLPSFVLPAGKPPVLIGLFNQLKQEYVSARFLYYEGIFARKHHYSDKRVTLVYGVDSPVNGLATEKIKIALRVAYSIFDKIAFFLNEYLRLEIPEKQISFRTIWFESDRKTLKPIFRNMTNWPFRGLFWMSKDFFESGFSDTIEPEAKSISEIRNHIEHKYVRVFWEETPSQSGEFDYSLLDPLSKNITKQDLHDKTLKLLKNARSALIYLSLGMNVEERAKQSNSANSGLSFPALQWICEDVWKL